MRSRLHGPALALLALLASGVCGCAGRAREVGPANTRVVPLATLAPELARYEASGTPVSRRFEFDRLDGDLGRRRSAPLRATRQWPQPPMPAERRIRFHYWEQR